jgi:divalent metal cation (Fe/Co/Zn/Cd) transporter
MNEERSTLVRRALRLESLTVGWNLTEGVIALLAAAATSSVALLAFGVDSFVECASALVIVWRFLAERRSEDEGHIERVEHRAGRLVAALLILLALYVAADAITTLVQAERPSASVGGIVLLSVSLVVMLWLARAKRRVAVALGSRAMQTDAFQTTACWWLSLIALVGIGLNALFGWWWADPVAALAMTPLLLSEAREAWRGDDCDD